MLATAPWSKMSTTGKDDLENVASHSNQSLMLRFYEEAPHKKYASWRSIRRETGRGLAYFMRGHGAALVFGLSIHQVRSIGQRPSWRPLETRLGHDERPAPVVYIGGTLRPVVCKRQVRCVDRLEQGRVERRYGLYARQNNPTGLSAGKQLFIIDCSECHKQGYFDAVAVLLILRRSISKVHACQECGCVHKTPAVWD